MKIPPGIVLRVLADVCGGLHSAHELREEDGSLLGVVHRDVSPQNILVGSKGVAKLIDFGIAKARDRLAGDTNAGQVKGKIRYMAPEQAVGGRVDRRADLWAIGAILYHLLSGKPPYDGDNDVQALMVLTSGRPPVPLPPSVHPAVASVVKKALTASVEHRFASAAELQEAIEQAIITAKLSTNVAAVAAFLGEHVADRAKKRKEAITIGVKAATDRDRYSELMRSNLKQTISGPGMTTGEIRALAVGTGVAGVSNHGMGTGAGMGSRSAHGTGAEVASRSASGSGSGSGHGAGSGVGADGSVMTGGTLGSAAIDLGAGRSSSGRTVAIVGVSAGALLGIAGLVMMLTRPPAERKEAAALAPAPVVLPISPSASVKPALPVAPVWTAMPGTVTPAPPGAPTAAHVPTVDANNLKPVNPTAVVSQPAPASPAPYARPVVSPTPAAKPAFKPTVTKKKVPDDGF